MSDAADPQQASYPEEPSMELDSRKQTILRAVVFEYVRGAEPIGSEVLASKYPLGVKSATIRNELADLADLGYLEQPHTSAGRIPSDRGYRYFVDRLIVSRDPEAPSRKQVKEAAGEGDALQDLLQETTRVLSRLTHLLTAATLVKNANLTIRSAVVSALGPKQALFVLALSNGAVENRMLEVPAELTLTELGRANEILIQTLVGQGLRSAARAKAPARQESQGVEKLLSVVWGGLRSISKEVSRSTITTQGEEFLFAQPEFNRDAASLAELLDSLKDSDVLSEAMHATTPQSQTVTIGKEHRSSKMHQLSIVRQSFFIGENEAGVIAVIGPTRMQYETSIPLVNFTANALTESLTKFLG